MPLYKVRDSEESKFIISQRINRCAEEESSQASTPQLNKKVTKLTWLEKRQLYSGNNTVMLNKMNKLDQGEIDELKIQLERNIQQQGTVKHFH